MLSERIAKFTVIIACLVGCQTIDIVKGKGPCSDLDWFELGRSDGTRGEASLKWQERAEACQGFSDVSHQRYNSGWYAGVDEFCSPTHGYIFGRTGLTYKEVCPVGKEKKFIKFYQRGLQVFLYEKNKKRLNEEIRKLEGTSVGRERQLSTLEGLLEERAENQKQISGIEQEMGTRIE